MAGLKQLIHEVHRRSLWQVLGIYLLASWVVFEVVQTVTEGLGLPQWFPALAALLLLIGLPIVLATAFVQEGGPPLGRTDPTLLPGAEVEHEAARRRAQGVRRLFTWRNAIMGGALAFGLWGVVATGWLVFSGSSDSEGVEAPLVARKSLAVIPFANMSADPENEYFSDGITDDIITHLSMIADLKVISRQSSMQYKGSEKSLRQIAEELGVATILEGGVQRIGDRVRVNAQLIDAETDEHVWVEQYNRQLTDVFAIQSDVAQQIAAALKATLTTTEEERIERAPTENLEAYDYYLRGMSYMHKVREEGNLRVSVRMFEKAVELDPQFALAYVSLGFAHSNLYWWFYDRTEARLAKIREAAEAALRIDPGLPEGQVALARYYFTLRQYDHAFELFTGAFEHDPNSDALTARLGDLARRRGEWDQSATMLRRAIELDPRNANHYYNIGATYYFMRAYEEAQRYYDQGLSLAADQSLSRIFKARLQIAWRGDVEGAWQILRGSPREITAAELLGGNISGSRWLFRILHRSSPATNIPSLESFGADTAMYFLARAELDRLQGEVDHARAAYDSARAPLERAIISTPSQPHVHGRLGIVYAGLGRKPDAIREGKFAAALLPLSKDAMDGTDWVAYLAEIYVMVGEYEAALDQIELLLSVPGWLSVEWLKLDPLWDPLRDHPRFQALLEK